MVDFAQQAIQQAFELAASVQGTTSPNPPVGAVVVRAGQVVGFGATQPPGEPHAERVALAMAGADAYGADLYVTLEPCTFQGRTPACTDAIIAAGIARVYFVFRDGDARMHPQGAQAILKAHGIDVIQIPPPNQRDALTIAPFRWRTQYQRPFVTLKYAMSLDGKIATHTGVSQWISNPLSRHIVHQIRNRVDAIITGSGTAVRDNPQLTVRGITAAHTPWRILIDSHGITPLTARLFDTTDAPTLVFTSMAAPGSWRNALCQAGVGVHCSSNTPIALPDVLTHLYTLGINHLLIEAGSGLAGVFSDHDCIDEVHAFIAPGFIGNPQAPGPIGGDGLGQLVDWQRFTIIDVQQIASDVHIHACRPSIFVHPHYHTKE